MDLSVILENQKLNIRTTAIIIHENKLLVHKNANEDFCALIGGRIQIGESSEEAIKREIFEEMGKKIEIKEFVTTIENFFDGDDVPYHEIMFVYRAEFVDKEDQKILTTIKNVEGEDELEYRWIDLNKLEEANFHPSVLIEMIKNNKFNAHVINDDRGKNSIMESNQAYEYIGKIVKVKIDRPLNSKHPKHGFIYPVNYGYVPNTISGDGEELDCYVLGIDEPIESFEGRCIAVIHRTNDNDDKLIIVPDGKDFTDEEIRELTHFQEQYFESEIIR